MPINDYKIASSTFVLSWIHWRLFASFLCYDRSLQYQSPFNTELIELDTIENQNASGCHCRCTLTHLPRWRRVCVYRWHSSSKPKKAMENLSRTMRQFRTRFSFLLSSSSFSCELARVPDSSGRHMYEFEYVHVHAADFWWVSCLCDRTALQSYCVDDLRCCCCGVERASLSSNTLRRNTHISVSLFIYF